MANYQVSKQKLVHLRLGEEAKCVLASSLREVESKGRGKFGLDDKRRKMIFKFQGSVIDEEIFAVLNGGCIIHMEEGETQNLTDLTTTLEKSAEPVAEMHEIADENEIDDRPTDEGDLGNIEDFVDKIVASLSVETRRCLKQPTILLTRYSKFIGEFAYAISNCSIQLNNKTAYMAIGRAMFQKFPAISVNTVQGSTVDVAPKKDKKKKSSLYPWSFFTSRLSQKMRHIRLGEKTAQKKTPAHTPANANVMPEKNTETTVTARKRLDLDFDVEEEHGVGEEAEAPETPTPEVDDGAVSIYVEIEKSKPDKARIKEIMRTTYAQRRIKIQALGLQAMSKYKFLLRPDLLYHEWTLHEGFVGLDMYRPRILSALLTVKRLKENLTNDAPVAVTDADFHPLLEYVEEATRYPGQITRPVVRTVKHD